VIIKKLYLFQLKLLAQWLKEKKYKDWNIISKFKQILVDMPWKSLTEITNCGIYLMHHMETFNGEEDWQCDFKENDQVKCPATFKDL